MNPDVVSAIARLRATNVLSGGPAALFERVARQQLVSIRLEVRVLLYVGALLLASGVGLFVAEHHRQIGPLAVAAAIGLAVAASFFWVMRQAPGFSWGEVEPPNVAFDYILLLGLLLFASELAYVEVQFTVLGPKWAYHLLVVGAVYLLAAYRCDSRIVLGLALTTLAAWRGISLSLISGSLGPGDPSALRFDAILLGGLYLAAAALSVRLTRKPHFEEVFANTGLLLLLGGLVSGALEDESRWPAWLAALLVVAGTVMWRSFRLGRALYFVQGIVAAYVGLLRLLFEPFRHTLSSIPFLLASLLGIAVLALSFVTHRRMRER